MVAFRRNRGGGSEEVGWVLCSTLQWIGSTVASCCRHWAEQVERGGPIPKEPQTTNDLNSANHGQRIRRPASHHNCTISVVGEDLPTTGRTLATGDTFSEHFQVAPGGADAAYEMLVHWGVQQELKDSPSRRILNGDMLVQLFWLLINRWFGI